MLEYGIILLYSISALYVMILLVRIRHLEYTPVLQGYDYLSHSATYYDKTSFFKYKVY